MADPIVRFEVRVERDPYAESPAAWVDGYSDCFLVFEHRQFHVPAPKGVDPDEFWLIPVTAYIHSGVSLSLGVHTGWDCSTGAVWVRKNVQWNHTKREVAAAVVDEWNQYLDGDVWRYEVVEITTCPCCGHNSEDVIESCGGFYDEDDARTEALACLPTKEDQ